MYHHNGPDSELQFVSTRARRLRSIDSDSKFSFIIKRFNHGVISMRRSIDRQVLPPHGIKKETTCAATKPTPFTIAYLKHGFEKQIRK
jgi:hypothetical protein